MPIDVYDAAAWMCITCLSEKSLQNGCAVDFEAFKECPNLRHIIVKGKNLKISPSAFRGCHAQVTFWGSEREWQAIVDHSRLEGIAGITFENTM